MGSVIPTVPVVPWSLPPRPFIPSVLPIAKLGAYNDANSFSTGLLGAQSTIPSTIPTTIPPYLTPSVKYIFNSVVIPRLSLRPGVFSFNLDLNPKS